VFSQVKIFLFGMGYTEIRVPIITGDTHNILLQTLFQTGVVGLILLALWVTKLICSVPLRNGIGFENKAYHLLILVGFFLPWLSLDMLYFNEFFYILVLYQVFRRQMNDWSELETQWEVKGGNSNG